VTAQCKNNPASEHRCKSRSRCPEQAVTFAGIRNKCLERLARLLESFESEVCRFYRLGGEEFMALFAGSNNDATDMAEAICERIYSKTLLREHDHAVTVSIGVAMLEGLEDGRA